MAESASCLLSETKTLIIEKRFPACYKEMPMTLKSLPLRPTTPAAKDKVPARQKRSKYNLIE